MGRIHADARDGKLPLHTAADVRFVGSLSGLLAEGPRRALLLAPMAGVDDGGAGVLVLADDGSIELANPAARGWLQELGADDASGHLPVVVRAVARRARDAATGNTNGHPIARARVRTASGTWLLAHGSLLGDGSAARATVILEAARAPQLAPLLADAYDLTERGRRVTQLVAQGLPTAAIASRLHLSTCTVQDHLKSIFEKTGVGTRGELVARLFIDFSTTPLASE